MRSIPRKMKKSFSPYLITEIARNLRGPPFSRFYHVFSQNIDDDYFFFRENNQIIGSYLEIEDITLEDYGEYKCEVSNGVDEEITLPAHVYRQGKFHPARITRNATRAYRWRKIEKETTAYPLVYH